MNKTFEEACQKADAEHAAKKAKANGGAASEAPSIEELQAAAGDLISTPDILARFGADVESAGLVGETSNAKILFLTLISRLFERPVSVAIKGVSAGGKSFTVEQVLKFFPSAAYFVRTGMSEKAIIYSDESYRYRIAAWSTRPPKLGPYCRLSPPVATPRASTMLHGRPCRPGSLPTSVR
jgi:hypothetical protein